MQTQDIQKQRILLTGGAGFIGSHLARYLKQNGHDVCVVDDFSGGVASNLNDEFDLDILFHSSDVFTIDCSNRERMGALMSGWKPETVVHLAANARESASQFQPHIVTRRNLDAYASTFSAAVEAGVQNVVCFSSIAVYGHQQPPFTEDMPPKPQDVYAINKTAMETMTQVLSSVHGLRYVIVRPYNVFGIRQRLNDLYRNVIGIWMNRIMREEPIIIFGDGKQRRAFTYIEDIVSPLCSLITHTDRFNGNTYNVGGFEHISLNDLAEKVRCAMGVPNHPLKHVEDRPMEVRVAYSSPEKAVRDLHLGIQHGIDQGILRMAKWASKQGPQDWVNADPIEITDSPLMPKAWR